MDLLINAAIFAVTAYLTLGFFRADGAWDPANGKKAFCYFTVQSNILCALASLLMCIVPGASWVWMLKYVGTVAVTVTLLTVFLFLGPSLGGVKELLKGRDLFMHLLTPLAAIVSFCALERRGLSFPAALAGLIPVALYGTLYLYQVVYAPADRRWEDFYGFNKNGKWPIAFAAMLGGTLLVCLAFLLLQDI